MSNRRDRAEAIRKVNQRASQAQSSSDKFDPREKTTVGNSVDIGNFSGEQLSDQVNIVQTYSSKIGADLIKKVDQEDKMI